VDHACKERFVSSYAEALLDLSKEPTSPSLLTLQLDEMAKVELKNSGTGKMSGAIYSGINSFSNVVENAMEKFTFTETHNPDLYPSNSRMEAEIIAFTLKLFRGDDESSAVLTSGGTDSIANAVLTYKHWGCKVKGIKKPNIIASIPTHIALDRACKYYNIELRFTHYKNGNVDLKKTECLSDSNTIAIWGSFNEYCWGVIEPIK